MFSVLVWAGKRDFQQFCDAKLPDVYPVASIFLASSTQAPKP